MQHEQRRGIATPVPDANSPTGNWWWKPAAYRSRCDEDQAQGPSQFTINRPVRHPTLIFRTNAQARHAWAGCARSRAWSMQSSRGALPLETVASRPTKALSVPESSPGLRDPGRAISRLQRRGVVVVAKPRGRNAGQEERSQLHGTMDPISGENHEALRAQMKQALAKTASLDSRSQA